MPEKCNAIFMNIFIWHTTTSSNDARARDCKVCLCRSVCMEKEVKKRQKLEKKQIKIINVFRKISAAPNAVLVILVCVLIICIGHECRKRERKSRAENKSKTESYCDCVVEIKQWNKRQRANRRHSVEDDKYEKNQNKTTTTTTSKWMSKREKEATPRNSSTLLNGIKSVGVFVWPHRSWNTDCGTVTERSKFNWCKLRERTEYSRLHTLQPYFYGWNYCGSSESEELVCLTKQKIINVKRRK